MEEKMLVVTLKLDHDKNVIKKNENNKKKEIHSMVTSTSTSTEKQTFMKKKAPYCQFTDTDVRKL